MALEEAMALPMLIEQDRIRRERLATETEMLEPGGYKCHAWPLSVRPYELVRWQTDSRQQRRARNRVAREPAK